MKKRVFAAALGMALTLLFCGAQAELKIEKNEVSMGLDSLVVFVAQDALPEGESAESLSEEATAANSLIAERMHLADAARVFTLGGTRGNHEREATIAQQGMLCADERAASLALVWNGQQPDGSYGARTYTCAVDLVTGEALGFERLFVDADAAAAAMEAIIESEVLEQMSDCMERADLLPMPRDSFYYDETGLTVCYDAERYSDYDGTSGAVHFAWYELEDYIGEESLVYALSRPMTADKSGMEETILSAKGFGGALNAGLGQRLGEVLGDFAPLNDPDYTRDSMVYLFKEPKLRGWAVEIPRYADTDEEDTEICAIRAGRISWFGLTTGKTTRGEIVTLLGEPQKAIEYTEDQAEDCLLCPGESLLYSVGGAVLEAHLREDGVLDCLILRSAMPE